MATSAREFIPERPSVRSLREAASACRGCDLWRTATQTVFSEGPAQARLMLVGEIPGDREDRMGRPFVGPAGRELDKALEAVGIDRSEIYLTNAAIVRRRDGEARTREREAFVADLRVAVDALRSSAG